MKTWLHEETAGKFSFRVKVSGTDAERYYGEAIRGQFHADDILHEEGDCWFDMAGTMDKVLSNLKAEVDEYQWLKK